ncbi:MAG: 4Fe-4S binding protein [Planctomycetes bacterium]|nr:4Fe-4S binding protein [Planctomycetota bacterium]
MPIRKIINIDEDKCDGCGLCAEACHEGAIRIIDGKARLVSDIYCDGLGDCLAECPQGAITIEERRAMPFDEKAVAARMAERKKSGHASPAVQGGCPGSALRTLNAPAATQNSTNHKAQPPHPVSGGCPGTAMRRFNQAAAFDRGASSSGSGDDQPCRLGHWPIQLMLVPPGAPFLQGKDLLICADCVPFTVPNFHERYLKGRSVLVGCPKLDDLAYYEEKLKAIFAEARPRSITVLKMEVPCCNGIAQATLTARNAANPETEVKVYTLGLQGAELRCDEVTAGVMA